MATPTKKGESKRKASQGKHTSTTATNQTPPKTQRKPKQPKLPEPIAVPFVKLNDYANRASAGSCLYHKQRRLECQQLLLAGLSFSDADSEAKRRAVIAREKATKGW